MKHFSIKPNILKSEFERKQDERNGATRDREANIDYEHVSIGLTHKEKEVVAKKIEILQDEERIVLQKIKDLKSPVKIYASQEDDKHARRYRYLRELIPVVEKRRDDLRASSLSHTQIVLAEFAATTFFMFILIRLAAENLDLIESFVSLTFFQSVYGMSKLTLYADMVLQDYPAVLAISYITAISFKDSKAFYDASLKTKLFYAFGIGLIGLFFSSLMFSY